GENAMPHAIDRSTGRAAVFVTRQPAWHGLGAVVQEAPTSVEAIRLAGLDWEVQKWPLQAYGVDGGGQAHVLDVSEQFAAVRTDVGAVLGVVSRRYRVFQNAEAFDFSDALVVEGLARYETADALHGGAARLAVSPPTPRASGARDRGPDRTLSALGQQPRRNDVSADGPDDGSSRLPEHAEPGLGPGGFSGGDGAAPGESR